MNEETDIVKKRFSCKVCDMTHEIELNKNLLEGKTMFPFSHIYLHGELKDILTILYIDSDLEIRGVDTEVLSRENIFSKEHMMEIISKMVGEIETLRSDYNTLYDKYQKLLKNPKDGGFLDIIKSIGEGIGDFVKSIFNPKSEE